jgi:hypothetical protein
MDSIDTEQPQRPNRPVFLTVLCILTFVNSGFLFLGVIINAISGKKSADEMETVMAQMTQSASQLRDQNMTWMADLIEKMGRMAVYTNDLFYVMLLVNILTFGLCLAGAILMFTGRKIGFHAYVFYNIIGIVAIYIAVPVNEVPSFIVIINVILSAIFIFMYSRNLHWLK